MEKEKEDKGYDDVQIDENWISQTDKLIIDPTLLMCQVCYGIPLQQYAQCSQCGRIFCENDYKLVQSKINSCPICKNSPFAKKVKPHILYTNIFSKILFECQLCDEKPSSMENYKDQKIKSQSQSKDLQEQREKERKKYTKQELSDHINDHHKKKIIDFIILYDFQVQYQKGKEKIVFDMFQNIQLNEAYIRIKSNHKIKPQFPYQLDSGGFIVINFDKQLVTNPISLKAGKLIKKPSKTLKKGKDYEVWAVQLDINFKYYSEKYQEQVKKEYEEFIKNHRKNEFILDIGDQRYRVSFTKMAQINTYTGFERRIQKKIVKFV